LVARLAAARMNVLYAGLHLLPLATSAAAAAAVATGAAR